MNIINIYQFHLRTGENGVKNRLCLGGQSFECHNNIMLYPPVVMSNVRKARSVLSFATVKSFTLFLQNR